MRNPRITVAGLLIAAGTLALFAGCASRSGDGMRVQLCDGETVVELGTAPATKQEGAAVAAALMAEWQRKHPERAWQQQDPVPAAMPAQDPEALLQQRFQLKQPHDNRGLLGEGQREGHPYRDFAERDVLLWERETYKLVLEGAQVFHDGGKLGSTIAVSCDMCHPDASNTHPETYPKYQTQIGRTVLLRHMINWCLEHPVRAKPMAHDDPRMIAMEAYIYAQRQGKTLSFGKH